MRKKSTSITFAQLLTATLLTTTLLTGAAPASAVSADPNTVVEAPPPPPLPQMVEPIEGSTADTALDDFLAGLCERMAVACYAHSTQEEIA